MADRRIDIEARWQGESLKRGTQQSVSDLKAFGQAAKSALGYLGVGFGGVQIARGLGNTIKLLGDANAIVKQLQATMERTGVSVDREWSNTARTMERLVRANRQFSSEQFESTLDVMVQQTKDYAKSLQNLQLAADLAAARHLDLQQAGDRVARAMIGETEALGDLFPSLRNLTRTGQVTAGTLEATARVMDFLRDRTRGASAAIQDQLTTATTGAKNELQELGKAAAGLLFDVENLPVAIRETTDKLQKMREASQKGAGGVGAVGLAAVKGFGPLALFNAEVAAFSAESRRAKKDAEDLSKAVEKMYPGAGKLQQIPKPTKPPGPTPEEQAKAEKERLKALWDQDAALNAHRKSVLALKADADKYFEDWKKLADVQRVSLLHLKRMVGVVPDIGAELNHSFQVRQELLFANVKGTLSGAIMAGGQGGWDGFVAYLRSTGLQILADLISKSVSRSLILSSGPGGLLDVFFGGGGGLSSGAGGGGLMAGRGPMATSRAQQMAWRMQRG